MTDDPTLLVEALTRSGRTLALAESFTGGRVLDALTNVPGASRVLLGGLVAYSDEIKSKHLRVPLADIAVHGAVSEPVARSMAGHARTYFGADFALATTGIAGPTGSTPTKPVGLSICAAAGAQTELATRARHAGSRTEVKQKATHQGLQTLLDLLRLEGIL